MQTHVGALAEFHFRCNSLSVQIFCNYMHLQWHFLAGISKGIVKQIAQREKSVFQTEKNSNNGGQNGSGNRRENAFDKSLPTTKINSNHVRAV